MSLYSIPMDAGQAEKLAVYKGSPWSFDLTIPGQFVSYYSMEKDSNNRTLHIARFDDSENVEYAHSEMLEFLGWSPDGRHFTYETRGDRPEIQNWVGDACGPSRFYFDKSVSKVEWLDGNRFVFEATEYDESNDSIEGTTRLYLAGVEEEARLLVEFAWRGWPAWQAIALCL